MSHVKLSTIFISFKSFKDLNRVIFCLEFFSNQKFYRLSPDLSKSKMAERSPKKPRLDEEKDEEKVSAPATRKRKRSSYTVKSFEAGTN